MEKILKMEIALFFLLLAVQTQQLYVSVENIRRPSSASLDPKPMLPI